MDFYNTLKERFEVVLKENDLLNSDININSKALSKEEAIGKTNRKDYPILTGKEVLLEADFNSNKGQAFTDRPKKFSGSLMDILNLDLNDYENRPLFIATINAVLKSLGLISKTVHCKGEEPENCSIEIEKFLSSKDILNLAIVGYQPAMIDRLKDKYNLRVLDLNKDNINTYRYNILIEDGSKKKEEIINWADLLLVTGSTVVNGTIIDYLNLNKEVYFFGTSIAGSAYLMDLNQLCFCN